MKKTFKHYFLIITVVCSFFVLSGCDPTSEYPIWFNEYSGDTLSNLKLAQDNFNCFGENISSDIVIYGWDEADGPDINYSEDPIGKELLVTFERRDKENLVDSTDVQPFRDAVVANGFVLDNDPASPTHNLYIKDDIEIGIYVMVDHFELMASQEF